MRASILTAILVLGGLVLAGPASAGSKAPLGFQLLCLRTPATCQGGGAAQVDATPSLMATIKQVNDQVNRTITPRSDNGPDIWSADATVGDCDVYVMVKRKALIRSGVPPSSLRIAYVKTRSGEGHAILVVKTSRGDYVLDNLNRSVRPLSQAGYRIISMSGASPRDWT